MFDKVAYKIDGRHRCIDFEEEVEGTKGWGKSGYPFKFAKLQETFLADFGEVLELGANGVGAGLQGCSGGELGDDGWADEVGVLDFFDGVEEFGWDHHVADSPTGKAVGFGKGVEADGVVIGA